MLAQLDQHAVDVDTLAIRTPDLDDVFFAVTGLPSHEPSTDKDAQ